MLADTKARGGPTAADLEDIPELTDEELAQCRRAVPPKILITARLDEDIIEWLKEGGDGYQTRMNAILRTVMERAQQRP
jgi:uncharacterized protein (DUF4415 family)